MTEQEIFDKVANHLLTQNEKSLGPDAFDLDRCMYRGPGGLKCAVGCLIPDHWYDPKMEDEPVHAIYRDYNLSRPLGVDPEHEAQVVDLLGRLQRVHDSYPPEQWRDRLEIVADVRRLTCPWWKHRH